MTAIAILSDNQHANEISRSLDVHFGKKGWDRVSSYQDAKERVLSIRGQVQPIVIVSLDAADDATVDRAVQFFHGIGQSQANRLLLASSELSPPQLHRIMQAGAESFLPVPFEDSDLKDVIHRLQSQKAHEQSVETRAPIFSFYHTTGGTGATTIAVNTAWNIANRKKGNKNVCLIDLDVQFGSVATYLDLPRREAALEFIENVATSDMTALTQASISVKDSLMVYTGAPDVLPTTILTETALKRLFDIATSQFDIVLVDLPAVMTDWLEAVLEQSSRMFLVSDASVRSAQSSLRFVRTLQSEQIESDKISLLLNRAPKLTDLTGRSKARALARSLNMDVYASFLDGQGAVAEACDQGEAVVATAHRNPFSRGVKRFADMLLKEVG